VPSSVTNPDAPATQNAPDSSTRHAWTLVAFMWVAYFLNYTDRQVIFSIFPVLKSELHFSDAQLGLTGSIFLWVYSICSPITGQIGDRYSKRLLVVLSLVLWSLVTALTGLANSPGTLLLLRGLIGISESLFMPAALALTVSAHGPGTRSRALAVLATAQLAGVVMGGWFGGFMAQHFQWRSAFFLLGLVGILYALPYRSFLSHTSENAAVETKPSGTGLAVATLVRIPTYLFVCVVFAAFNFVLWLLYTWLPTFFFEKFSLNLADAGFTATVYLQSATFIGLLSGGTLADWLYTRTKAARLWIICFGLFLVAPCVHFIGHSESLLLAKIAALGCGLGCGFTIANLVASSYEVVPADTRASAVGCLNFVAFIAGFASLLGGTLKKSVGIATMMSYGALICIAAALILILCIKLTFQKDYDRVH
jgi:predicted MFS family arabinose efflux permease